MLKGKKFDAFALYIIIGQNYAMAQSMTEMSLRKKSKNWER